MLNSKFCVVCGSSFIPNKFHPSQSYCTKKCRVNFKWKQWEIANPEKKKEKYKRYRANHKDKLKAYSSSDKEKERKKKWHENNPNYLKDWREKNKDRTRAYDRERYLVRRDKLLAYQKKYRQDNKLAINVKKRAWFNSKMKSDMAFMIKKRLRLRLRQAFKLYSEKSKLTSSRAYGVDWNAIVLKLYSELPSDFGEREYHIDHIVPLASFDFNDVEQVRLAFAPENHQWLLADVNISKADKIIDTFIY